MDLRRRTSEAIQRRLAPSPVTARHAEYSMLYSEDDSMGRPNERLLDLAVEAIGCARKISLQDICARLGGRFSYGDDLINLWPGEHYRLLASFVEIIRPSLVIEIGTGEGLSALSMLKYLSRDARLITFDVIAWRDYPRACLTEDDFADHRLKQVVTNLADPTAFAEYAELFQEADLIFIDAAKDGTFERTLLEKLDQLVYAKPPIFAFDDIRLWNMLSVWRDLRWPKLDLTSFGHWCGTGISEPLRA